MKWLMFLLLLPLAAYAGPYLELGLSKVDGESCIQNVDVGTARMNDYTYRYYSASCSESPLGSVAIGYSYKGFSAEIEHYSSLKDHDYGLNLFSIKYRIGK